MKGNGIRIKNLIEVFMQPSGNGMKMKWLILSCLLTIKNQNEMYIMILYKKGSTFNIVFFQITRILILS